MFNSECFTHANSSYDNSTYSVEVEFRTSKKKKKNQNTLLKEKRNNLIKSSYISSSLNARCSGAETYKLYSKKIIYYL